MNTLTIAGWASTPVVDQSNEFIEASVLDMSTYDLNPVLMFCHDHKSPPIGIAKHYRLKPYTNGFNGLWVEQYDFNPNSERAVEIYQAYKAGYMRGFSVGFRPTGWRNMTREELRKAGEDPTKRAKWLNGGLLIEISAIPIPDNQLALAEPVVKSILGNMPKDIREKSISMASRTITKGVRFPIAHKYPINPMGDNMADLFDESIEVKEMADDLGNGGDTEAVDEMAKGEVADDQDPSLTLGENAKAGAKAVHVLAHHCMKGFIEGHKHLDQSDHPQLVGQFGKAAGKALMHIGKLCHKAAGHYAEHADHFKGLGDSMGATSEDGDVDDERPVQDVDAGEDVDSVADEGQTDDVEGKGFDTLELDLKAFNDGMEELRSLVNLHTDILDGLVDASQEIRERVQHINR